MSDEAVVRIILQEGAGSAARTTSNAAMQSPPAGSGITSPIASGAGYDRLYREMASSVTQLSKGFTVSLRPVVNRLEEISGLLTKDYDISDKEYIEVQAQTSVLKTIYASMRGGRAINDELSKGSGLDTSDRQTVQSIRETTSAVTGLGNKIDYFNKNLNPEKERTGGLIPEILESYVTAAKIILFPITLPLLGLMKGFDFLFGKETKEKSTNELLADISKGLEPLSLDTTSEKIALNTRHTWNAVATVNEKVLKILETMPDGKDAYGSTEGTKGLSLELQETDSERMIRKMGGDASTDSLAVDLALEKEKLIDEPPLDKPKPPKSEAKKKHDAWLKERLDDAFDKDMKTDYLQKQALETAELEKELASVDIPDQENLDENTRALIGLGYGGEDSSSAAIAFDEDAEIGQYKEQPQDQPVSGYIDYKPDTQVDIPNSPKKKVPDTNVEIPDASNQAPDTHIDNYGMPGEEPIITEEELKLAKDDSWAKWVPKYMPPNPLTPKQRKWMTDRGFTPPKVGFSDSAFTAFIQELENQGPVPGRFPFAKGGSVNNHPGGPQGTDTVPAWLTEGEFVVNKDAAQANKDELEDMNNGNTNNMSKGGIVNYLAEGGKADKSERSWGKWASETAKGTASALGGAAKSAVSIGVDANSDPAATVGKLGSAISSVGDSLMAANPVIGGFVKGLGMAGEAVGALMSAINEVANKYGEYSPEIAQAQAIAEIRQTMGDFRRAQDSGGELAKFVMAQSDMQQKFEEIKIKLLMEIVPVVNGIMEIISALMASGDGVETAINALLGPLASIATTANQINAVQQDSRLNEMNDPTSALFDTREGHRMDVSQGGGGFMPNQ